jgi:hypothetical protein
MSTSVLNVFKLAAQLGLAKFFIYILYGNKVETLLDCGFGSHLSERELYPDLTKIKAFPILIFFSPSKAEPILLVG